LIASLSLALTASLGMAAPAFAEKWKASECRPDRDGAGAPIKVCDDGYHLGALWADGAYVNGACTDDGDYEVEYEGMSSKSEAIEWVEQFCP
jgi:hypothetical protein